MRIIPILLFPIQLLIAIPACLIYTIFYVSLIISVAIPSHLFRILVSFICRKLDVNLCKLVTALGTSSSRDFSKWLTSPSQSLNIIITLKGSPSFEEFQNLILDKLIYRNTNCNLHYPELQQYCTKRLGYLFFKWDREFDIKNHLKYYQSEKLLPHPETDVVDDEKLNEIYEDIGYRPFLPKRSAWEFLFIPNYQPSKKANEAEEKYAAVIFRMHHGLADGISVYRILLQLTDTGEEIWDREHSLQKLPKYFGLWLHLKGMFIGPSAFIWKGIRNGIDFRNHLHKSRHQKAGKHFTAFKAIDLELVKNVKRLNHGIFFHSVLIAGLAGGIRNYFLENNKRIPLSPIRVGMPVPIPGHSKLLRNEFLLTGIELPVRERTAKRRLLFTEQRLRELASSAFTPYLSHMAKAVGGLPVKWIKALTREHACSVIYSSIKGPEYAMTVEDGKYVLDDFFFNCSLGPDTMGMMFGSFSYKGKLNLIVTVDQGLVKTREKAYEILHYIEREIEDLQYGDFNNL